MASPQPTEAALVPTSLTQHRAHLAEVCLALVGLLLPAVARAQSVDTSLWGTDGAVTASGNAAKWAVVDSVNSRLLANGSLSVSQPVTSGNTFTLAAFNIRIPNQ